MGNVLQSSRVSLSPMHTNCALNGAMVARRPVYVQYVQFTYLQSKFADWHFIFYLRPYPSSLFCENCFGCDSIFDCIFGFKLFASSKVFVLKISPRPPCPDFGRRIKTFGCKKDIPIYVKGM